MGLYSFQILSHTYAMRPDIVNLRQFYSSPLRQKVRRRLRGMVRGYWRTGGGLNVVGIGYTTDLLPLPEDAAHKDSRIVALMPELQGAIYWPVDAANHSILADEMRPPFMPSAIHRVLMTHAFEHAPAPDELLRIWWQLLVPGGRLLLVMPNRHGLWSRFGATPFTSGTSYTLGEARQLLNNASFTIRDVRSACYALPSSHPLWLTLFGVIEWLGTAFFPWLGGVLVIEAEKQIYAGVRVTPNVVKPRAQWAGTPALGSASISQNTHTAESRKP